jgi:hypothetical protein
VLDLCERQTKPTSLTDECEQLQHVVWITSVTGFRTTRRGQNAACLVQPQGLAADTAALCDLSDEQTMLHESMIGLSPRGKVKSE